MTKSQKVLSDLVIYNKYAKYLPDLKRRETWEEIVARNKDMHYRKLKEGEKEGKYKLTENDWKEFDEVYQMVLDKKVLPSMRSMQFAGRACEINNLKMYNCSYLPMDNWKAFQECVFGMMSGTGVGISVQKHHVAKLPEIKIPTSERKYLIADSGEGWADAVQVLMKAYFGVNNSPRPKFDFRAIRAKGEPIKTSGGKAPGPEPLQECLFQIEKILRRKKNGEKLQPIEVYDIVCYIADMILAGGVRRAAALTLFSVDDEDMLYCKSGNWWETNPQRARSNNSVAIVRYKITEEKFKELWNIIKMNKSGEPGIIFTNDKDWGVNPCAEISLRPMGLCNLTEVNAGNVESQEDLNARAKAAAILGTIQATYTDFYYIREEWKENAEKDALIGVSMTGVANTKMDSMNLKEAAKVVKDTNAKWAKILGIKTAARCTTLKPAGTSSCVLGTSSGIHPWHAKYYVRRFKVGKTEDLYEYFKRTNPGLVEDDVMKPHIQGVISVPQEAPEGAITRGEDTMEFLKRIQRFNLEWVHEGYRRGANNNNVSATISVKPDEWDKVGQWIWDNRMDFNGLSVLPWFDESTAQYPQLPFEEITKEEFDRLNALVNDIDLTKVYEEENKVDFTQESACSGGSCEITSF